MRFNIKRNFVYVFLLTIGKVAVIIQKLTENGR